jgi:hypothetical protein
MQAIKITIIQQWNKTLWSQQNNLKKQFSFGDNVLWFLKSNKSHLRKFTRQWFGLYIIQCVLEILFVSNFNVDECVKHSSKG